MALSGLCRFRMLYKIAGEPALVILAREIATYLHKALEQSASSRSIK